MVRAAKAGPANTAIDMDQRRRDHTRTKVGLVKRTKVVFKSHPRQSKTVTGFALGVWLFALFVGIVHACTLTELGMTPGQVSVTSVRACTFGEGIPAGCDQFCKSDVPVVSKAPLIGERSAAQLPIAVATDVHVVLALPPASLPARAAHPSSGVPPILHFTRLRL